MTEINLIEDKIGVPFSDSFSFFSMFDIWKEKLSK